MIPGRAYGVGDSWELRRHLDSAIYERSSSGVQPTHDKQTIEKDKTLAEAESSF